MQSHTHQDLYLYVLVNTIFLHFSPYDRRPLSVHHLYLYVWFVSIPTLYFCIQFMSHSPFFLCYYLPIRQTHNTTWTYFLCYCLLIFLHFSIHTRLLIFLHFSINTFSINTRLSMKSGRILFLYIHREGKTELSF